LKILLINPPVRTWAEPNVFPLGLGYISAILNQSTQNVHVLDINAHRHSREYVEGYIKGYEADIYGIGGIITTYNYVKWLVGIIKKYHPNKRVMIGGAVASSIPHIWEKDDNVDHIIIGEGEAAVLDVILRPYAKIMEKPAIEDLDLIPSPDWEAFPINIYLKNPIGFLNVNKWDSGSAENKQLSMNLYAGRGCGFNCIYCYKDFMGYKYRHRSARNVVEEMEKLFINYGATYFHFIDDELMMSKKFVSYS